MSRHGNEPESQIVLKRPRQEDRLIQQATSTSIPRSIVSNVPGFDMFPAIRGVQHVSNWMSNLIQAQDGCLQMDGFLGSPVPDPLPPPPPPEPSGGPPPEVLGCVCRGVHCLG